MTIEPFSTPERRPAADAAEARAITEGVRDALRVHARTGIVLARRVRRAHAARVWTALGSPSWEAYARAELGVSRASAYRLLDMAVVLDQLDQAVTDLGMSPFGDILEITRQQAREIKGRVAEVAAVLADLLAERGPGLEPAAVARLLSAAVDKVRKTPPRREVTTGMHAQEQRKERFEYWLGTVVLDTAPAHLTDADAAEALRAHDPELTTADTPSAAPTASVRTDRHTGRQVQSAGKDAQGVTGSQPVRSRSRMKRSPARGPGAEAS
ncbi:hypothetical protein [Streptomyces flavidovirens]|uniref:hypothetical protein n=1 Tax=Streptomyces flavidovirens TaxID=67298 RepID=UPI0003FA75A1|nr:hypothetical protein [Streptomyces flavidovirens]